jgi:hypothetical protein
MKTTFLRFALATLMVSSARAAPPAKATRSGSSSGSGVGKELKLQPDDQDLAETTAWIKGKVEATEPEMNASGENYKGESTHHCSKSTYEVTFAGCGVTLRLRMVGFGADGDRDTWCSNPPGGQLVSDWSWKYEFDLKKIGNVEVKTTPVSESIGTTTVVRNSTASVLMTTFNSEKAIALAKVNSDRQYDFKSRAWKPAVIKESAERTNGLSIEVSDEALASRLVKAIDHARKVCGARDERF